MAQKKRENLPAQKYTHSQPTELRLAFELTGGATRYLDLAAALSAVNRKFISQQAYFYVSKIECYNSSDFLVDIHTLPDTWTVKNAYRRGRALYDANRALLNPPVTGGLEAKYEDFKIFMSNRHATEGLSILPAGYEINQAAVNIQADSWQYSQLVSADDDGDANQNSDKFTLHMIGDHNGSSDNWSSVGLVKSYEQSRVTVHDSSPNTANVSISDPLMNLHDNSSEEQINELATLAMQENAQPPYDSDKYFGHGNASMVQRARLVTTSSLGRIAMAPGFCAPFGLVCVDPSPGTSSSDNYRIVVTMAPGPYHGVYAERV